MHSLATLGADGSKKRAPKGIEKTARPARLQQDVADVFNSFGAEILYEDVEAAVGGYSSLKLVACSNSLLSTPCAKLC